VSSPDNAAFECLTALSVIFDLANGLADDKSLLSAVLAADVAGEAGGDEAAQRCAFLAALLRHLGCTAYAPAEAELADDDVALRSAAIYAAPASPGDALRIIARANGRAAGRWRGTLRFVARARSWRREWQSEACGAARILAAGLELGGDVIEALDQVFENWDGSGGPAGVRGAEMSLGCRAAQAAHVAVIFWLRGGTAEAEAALARADGWRLDPRMARVAAELVRALTPPSAQYLADRRERAARLVARDWQPSIEAVAETFGDFADLQARFACGHSRAVAALCERMAGELHLPAAERRAVRLAGHLHDLGQVAVPTSVWSAPRRFGPAEHERARLHVYFTERVLSAAAPLATVARIAGAHHERLDGSGFHRGLQQPSLGRAARILAVADVACALRAARPHRPALSPAAAARELRAEARAGRLDAACVEAACAAMGERSRAAPAAAPELTPRELEVLRLVAVGLTNKQIGRQLGISARTVQHHTMHIYGKLGVDTRAAAALVASRHGWLEPP
jgi:HD-GYP domain-containing protein (c-di-GMP phosphodiesterase class II)